MISKIVACFLIALLNFFAIQASANQEVRLGEMFCEKLDQNSMRLRNIANDLGILVENMETRYRRIYLYERGSLNEEQRNASAMMFMTARLFRLQVNHAYLRTLDKCEASNESPDPEWLEFIGREVFRATGELEAWINNNRLPYGENKQRAIEFCEKLDYNILAIPKLAKKFGVNESLVPATLMESMASTMVPYEDVKWIMAKFRLVYEAFYREGGNGNLKESLMQGCENDLTFVAEVLDSNRQAFVNESYLSGFSFFADGSFNSEDSMGDEIYEWMCESPKEATSSVFDAIERKKSSLESFNVWAISMASEGNGFAMHTRDIAALVAISWISITVAEYFSSYAENMDVISKNQPLVLHVIEQACADTAAASMHKTLLRLIQFVFDKKDYRKVI